MEEKAQSQAKSKSNQKWIILLLLLLIVLMGVILAVVLLRDNTQSISDNDTPMVGYSTEAKVMLDQDSLQAAVDEAMENAEKAQVALQYQNNAYSTDGKTFSCYIINAPTNLYDMFLTIFADPELTDQLYLTGLIPPGSGFEEITLDHELEPGDHTVYVAVTQVDTDENGNQVIAHQVMHTIEFHVTKP